MMHSRSQKKNDKVVYPKDQIDGKISWFNFSFILTHQIIDLNEEDSNEGLSKTQSLDDKNNQQLAVNHEADGT